MKIKGFTLVHNAFNAGMPIVEAVQAVREFVDNIVAVDMSSTDGTREVLTKIGCQVFDSDWNRDGDNTLRRAFEMHKLLEADLIVFFEADEVYSPNLLSEILWAVERGHRSIGCHRIQVEQNFQRVRWYPHAVHRVFTPGSVQYYPPHPVDCLHCSDDTLILSPEYGYLFDCSNIFRDQWVARKEQQAEIWKHNRPLSVAHHFAFTNETEPDFNSPHWLWKDSPLCLPPILVPLLGQTKYDPKL